MLARRLAITLLSVLAALGILEIAVRKLVAPPAWRRAVALTPLYSSTGDPDLGFRMRPSTTFRAIKGFSRDDVCYDVSYTIDAFGRRMVSSSTPPGLRSLVFFGCSFTFGEGLRDEDTLQFLLSEHYAIANYAVPGYGPQHVLAKIQQGALFDEISLPAAAVYLLPPFHLSRANAHSNQSWLFSSPYYTFDREGRIARAGSFRTGRRFTTKAYKLYERLRGQSRALALLGYTLPPRTTDHDATLTAAIIAEAAKRFVERAGGPFLVVLHPWWGHEGSSEHRLLLVRELQSVPGIVILDYSSMAVSTPDMIRPACDNHPSAALARRLAGALRRDLPRFVDAHASER